MLSKFSAIAKTLLGAVLAGNSRKYLTDGYCVYALCLPKEKYKVTPQTLLTRVEGENTRVRHFYVTQNLLKCWNIP